MTQQMAATGNSPKRNHAATMPAMMPTAHPDAQNNVNIRAALAAMMPSENVTAK